MFLGPADRDEGVCCCGFTDADGAFEIGGLMPGKMSLCSITEVRKVCLETHVTLTKEALQELGELVFDPNE